MFQVSHKPSSVPQSGNDNLSKHGGQIHLPSRNWYIWSAPLAPNEACHRRMLPCGRVSSYLPDHIAIVGLRILDKSRHRSTISTLLPRQVGVSGIFSVALFSNLTTCSFSRAFCSMVPGLSSPLSQGCRRVWHETILL